MKSLWMRIARPVADSVLNIQHNIMIQNREMVLIGQGVHLVIVEVVR